MHMHTWNVLKFSRVRYCAKPMLHVYVCQISVEDELEMLVGNLSTKDVGACTRHFMEAAQKCRRKSRKSSNKVHSLSCNFSCH